MCQLLVAANVVLCSPIVTLMMEVLQSSETLITNADYASMQDDLVLCIQHL
jgi:hypothetical protein